jgi:hypothetical protein
MSLLTSGEILDFIKSGVGIENDEKADEKAKEHIAKIFEHGVNGDWNSSGLKNDNAFSALIVLRTAGLLLKSNAIPSSVSVLEMEHPIETLEEIARRIIKEPSGQRLELSRRTLHEIALDIANDATRSFRVEGYPSTPALAYWFVDGIENLNLYLEITEERWNVIVSWVSETFARHVSLVTSRHDAMKDPVQMAMAACLATRMRRIVARGNFGSRDTMIKLLPTDIEIQHAIFLAFKHQEQSGIWPKYFPLFNYKKEGVGSNYFFSFELLEVIVEEFEDTNLLEDDLVLNGIERALTWCESNRLIYRHNDKTYEGWNSGGQITTLSEGKPESWATAVIHMFLRKLRSSLSLQIEKHILAKYGTSHRTAMMGKSVEPWEDYIDSPLELQGGETTTVKDLIQEQILGHIEKREEPSDKKLNHRRSALLFGPPGTAKTSLVRAIAKKIGWPLVELNPSDFLKNGLENVYSQANIIFEDLQELSHTVIFFDEMDALAQRREQGLDVTRQLLTTSMLPKLSMLHDEKRVLFFMATNHQRSFDEAIKRPGRFDLLIHMTPPSWEKKTEPENIKLAWPKEKGEKVSFEDYELVSAKLRKWVPKDHRLAEVLDLFTFGEFKSFLEQVRGKESLSIAIKKTHDPSDFYKKVEEWGNKYIVLRTPGSSETATAELSLRQEFEEDRHASRLQ